MAARDDLKARLFRAVDEDEVLDLLRRAIRTPSVTTEEAVFGHFLHRELEAIGLDRVERVDFAPNRPNVWGMRRGAGGGPRLMFAGHTDTVGVAGWADRWRGTPRADPFSGALDDGEVWGRGAADMKAGIVATLCALKAIARADVKLAGDVVVAFVGDEESGVPGSGRSDGMKAMVRQIAAGEIPRPDFVVYAEPTTLDVYPAQIGFVIAEVRVTGTSAYFGLPWHGVDALKGAHRLLGRLYAYSDEIWARAHHPLLGRAFNLVTAIQGGGYVAVPDACTLSMIRAILPGETVEEVQAELAGIVRLAAMNEGVRIEIAFTAGRDSAFGGRPAEVPTTLAPVACLASAVRETTGKRDVVAGAPFWSEISFFVHELGIPAVYCGPGNILNCHTFNERVELRELLAAVKTFALMMVDYCGVEEQSAAEGRAADVPFA